MGDMRDEGDAFCIISGWCNLDWRGVCYNGDGVTQNHPLVCPMVWIKCCSRVNVMPLLFGLCIADDGLNGVIKNYPRPLSFYTKAGI